MSLAATADLVSDAAAAHRGVAAFNVITLEHAEAIVCGAEAAGAPVILQISENAVAFHGGRAEAILSGAGAVARASTVPVALHLDHLTDAALLSDEAVAVGVSSVMFDASAQDYPANVRGTAQAARWAHERGLWLEAELGEVGGKNGAHAPGVRTDPAEAAAYTAATGVDALAVAVGSTHAMTARTARLDQALIRRLSSAVPVPLVLHGSSGVPEAELRAAVRSGMVKINIGTALNSAFTRTIRGRLQEHPDAVDPRGYLGAAREAMSAVVRRTLCLLSS